MRDVLTQSRVVKLGLAAEEMQNQQPLQQINLDKVQVNGGRFDFDDGGTYCGGWEDGKAHGHGVCTGPKGQGEYSGSWHYGFEVSGVYTWPSGSTYEGHWQNGKRHGLGVESRGRWVYRGEWTQGYKGRYGVRQSNTSGAKYEGTWANGLQDGYGSETYADGGTFQGQWLRGLRHGIGVRTSAAFGVASFYRNKATRVSTTSLRSESAGDAATDRDRKIDDCRGGFVLKAKSDEPPARRRSLAEKSTNLKKSILHGLRIKKQRSTGDIDKRGGGSIRSTGSGTSWASNESGQSGVTNTSRHTDSNVSFVSQDDVIEANVTETYMGEWKNDKRCGFGISERSDGLKYEGEWYNNKKYGYGVTVLKDGSREEGKYKNNTLITSNKKKHIFLIRSAKFRERVDSAVNAAIRASQIALQKADIAISRTATARGKAEQADVAAMHAREDSDFARLCGKQFAPDFHQPGIELLKKKPSDGRPQLQPVPKPRDDHHAFRSRSMYNRKDDLDSSNPSVVASSGGGDEEHLSPGGLRMSIDYGNYKDNPRSLSDHMPTVEDTLLMQHSMTNPKLSGYNYLDPSSIGEPMSHHLIMTANGGAPNVNPSSDAFSLRGSIRRGKNLSIREDPRRGGDGGGGGGGGGGRRGYSVQQAMNDHFDQYQTDSSHLRNSSRSSSRAGSSTTVASALAFAQALRSRPPSVDTTHPADLSANQYGTDWTPDSGVSDGMDTDESPTRPSRRSTLPNLYNDESVANALNTHVADEDTIGLHRRTGGTPLPPDIPSPQRTSSLYVNATVKKNPGTGVGGAGGGAGGGGGGGGVRGATPAASAPPKRKKSLPDIQQLPKQISVMSREEVSVLSSARREEVRRQQDEANRYRANPLLYLFSPNVKDWLSRQQLMMVVLFINISLAIMFFNLLT